jgi:aryl-alcohol dehydrogenase-like predicted oxidoreductase
MMEALLTLQEKGKIRAFGVSNFTAEMMERCLQMAPLASLQPPYSLLVRDIEENIVPFCQGHSIGIICYSPMFRGLLTGKFSEDHEFSEGDTRAKNPWYRGERLKSVNRVLREVVKPIADHHGVQTAQIAVAWCLARPGITAALVGARNRQQALANVQAGNVNLSTEDVTRITAAFDELLGKYA